MAQNKAYTAFIEKWKGYAEQLQVKYGVPAALTLAQAIKESGGGTSSIARTNNNYFGIRPKSGRGFMSFPNTPKDSFYYYVRLLSGSFGNSYKGRTENLSPSDLNGWYKALLDGGYCKGARFNGYIQDIDNIIKTYGLEKYTQEGYQLAQAQHRQTGYLKGHPEGDDEHPHEEAVGSMTSAYEWQQEEDAAFQQSANQYYSSHELPQDYKIPLKFIDKNWSMPLKSLDLTVTDIYGKRPTSYRDHVHRGLDLRAHYVPCLATEDGGRVIEARQGGHGAGNMLTVEYDRGDKKIRVTYMHLDKFLVNKGDSVHAGQEIAISGRSGGVDPHLHVQVKVDNGDGKGFQYIDPALYITSLAVRMGYEPKLIDKHSGKDLSSKYQNGMGVVAGDGSGVQLRENQLANLQKGQEWLNELYSSADGYQKLLSQEGDDSMSQGGDVFSAILSAVVGCLSKFAEILIPLELAEKMQGTQKNGILQDTTPRPTEGIVNTISDGTRKDLDAMDTTLKQTATATYQDDMNQRTNDQELTRGQV